MSAEEGETPAIRWMETDGGVKGREVLDNFLRDFEKFLKPAGRIVFLQTDVNGIPETLEKLKQQGFAGKILARKKLFFEELVVIEAKRIAI